MCVDLYRGGEIPRGVLGKPFLRQLRTLLLPRALVAVNLFPGRRVTQQVHRLALVFHVLKQLRVGDNVVVHCRGR